MVKKSKFRPVTALKRSVVFDGSGRLRCERCGKEERLVFPIYPSLPKEQMHWTIKFNARIGKFLEEHRDCD